jgi:hypothetical protein
LRRYEKPNGISFPFKNAYYHLPGHSRRLQFATENQCNVQILMADRSVGTWSQKAAFLETQIARKPYQSFVH